MKRILSLVLSVVMVAALFSGCFSQEYSVKVKKNGSTSISLFMAIPVENIEAMKEQSAEAEASGEESEVVLDADTLAMIESMEVKKVKGVDCYVAEDVQNFKSTKKANKYMVEGDDTYGSTYFEKFNLTTKDFTATVIEGMKEAEQLYSAYGEGFGLKLSITMPYVITKTNGTLSDNKKTVSFDLVDDVKLYAYTTKSNKSAKVYFKKDYLKSNTKAYLDWNNVSGAKKYKLQYKLSSAKKWKSVTTTKSEATVKKLKVGKKYVFKVTAITDTKNYTSIKTVITTLKKTTAAVKAKTDKTVQLKWNKNTNADGYYVYKKAAKNAEWQKVKSIKDPYINTYTVKKLESGNKYYFKVVSYSNENGKKIMSAGKTATATTK